MFVYERHVRFEEVDAASIVFFPRFFVYCHEAMEAMLAPIHGGYAGLVVDRRLGLPTVHVEADFKSPLRFGDVARIGVTVERIGRSSCTLRFQVSRVSRVSRTADATEVALVRHVVVVSDLGAVPGALTSVPIPEDVRAILESHAELAAAP